MEALAFERTITELDHVRLTNLVGRRRQGDPSPAARHDELEQILDHSAVVPSRTVAPDVVTMGSRVLLQDATTGVRSELTLCYPADADPAVGAVSVLSPVGSSLLGLRVGEVARWCTPAGGGERTAELVAILFQPEGSGDFVM